ncbi:uncharacterized protein LOC111407548 isoform X1 [Olea europaea var. sylvestris]|uniref:Uncharacterized protein LOC111407548 isoform X1 n=1 Tax=Olea europaea subsp. europaea TaxID=158383 RepID=A0A8S0Q118_OLEEU|nr:uncharacterized protein LOC111407548 isoform X1 [Olea europaea var. sylvestris]CAA2958296.1 uncharacterized protein LOC111407548 isoform X1 [Olea europaea subsp. europaea]
MRGGRSSLVTLAKKCKDILASNWQGNLNTIKADAKGSKEEIYTSKVKYLLRKENPYIWVPEKDLHNVNTIIDERGSFAVTSPLPSPLANLLRSLKKLPTRVALTGDVVLLKDNKAKLAAECLRDTILSDQRAVEESSNSVSGILSSCLHSTLRSKNLLELLEDIEQYTVYKFNPRSCTYISWDGGNHEVDLEHFEASKSDPLLPFSMGLIDGINQNETRRRALILFCITFLNENAKDAFLLSIDRSGFDVLAKVFGSVNNGPQMYQWRELRLSFKEEARDAETFCQRLVEMEEEALKNVSSFSGI